LVKANCFFTGTPAPQLLCVDQLVELARRVDYCAHRLAIELRLTRRTLERRFREQLGCAPGEWLAHRRMADAVMLIERRFTMKEVADGVGYQHSSSFVREFRRRVGCAPSAYLKTRPVVTPVLVSYLPTPVSQTANLLSQTANSPRLQSACAA
jgi:AraC-like DNA-binding protein